MSERVFKCGWCLTGHHASCKTSITYYEREYVCKCECHEETLATDNETANLA